MRGRGSHRSGSWRSLGSDREAHGYRVGFGEGAPTCRRGHIARIRASSPICRYQWIQSKLITDSGGTHTYAQELGIFDILNCPEVMVPGNIAVLNRAESPSGCTLQKPAAGGSLRTSGLLLWNESRRTKSPFVTPFRSVAEISSCGGAYPSSVGACYRFRHPG